MNRDDLNVLSAFMAVAEERSFTKAARRLGCRIRAEPGHSGTRGRDWRAIAGADAARRRADSGWRRIASSAAARAEGCPRGARQARRSTLGNRFRLRVLTHTDTLQRTPHQRLHGKQWGVSQDVADAHRGSPVLLSMEHRAPSATPPAGACAATHPVATGGGTTKRCSPPTRRG